MSHSRRIQGGLLAIAALVLLVYANHFQNDFHFDDSHSVVQNPYIRDLSNFGGFFTNIETSTVLPANRVWRPLVTASLAFDYWLGRGLKPFYFHVSTMFWFLVQLALMFALFLKIFDYARPDPRNAWAALFGTALYGVHPANAETVNYIVQRAEIYSTLGVIAGLVMYQYLPGLRKYGLYLLPVAAAMMSKAPALVFPVLLFLYIWLFEDETPKSALVRSVPSIAVVAVMGYIGAAMLPASFVPGSASPWGYRITQPVVIFRYFRTFFIPTGLTADTDRVPFDSIFQDDALAGFLFAIALIVVAIRTMRQRETRPIAFGLFWFIVTLLPTSVFPLAEVENDHRMFFPFVGLALAAVWAAALWLYSRADSGVPWPRAAIVTVCGLVLATFAWGTRERNKVWRSEESLWYDVTLKSPHNGRGLMNYGLSRMEKGDYPVALDYFQRALTYNPNYYVLEVNLGVVNGALHNDAEAERHFARANQLAPNDAIPHYFYAVWLNGRGRLNEAVQNLNAAIAANPAYLDAQHLLMAIYAQQGNAEGLRTVAQQTLAVFPSDPGAKAWLARGPGIKPSPSPENYLNQSLAFYQQGKFADSIAAAREALKLRPGYSDAWNNIAAAYNAQGRWDEGIQAAAEAVRLGPNNQLAKNNLAWAVQQKAKAAPVKR